MTYQVVIPRTIYRPVESHVLPAIPLALKIGILFDAVAAQQGWLPRVVIRAAKSIVIAELPAIAEWANNLVTSGRVADGVNSLRKWLKERIRSATPRWVRFLVCPLKCVDRFCDLILENEDELLAEVRTIAAPPAK